MSAADPAHVERVLRDHVLPRYAPGTPEDAFSSDEDLLASGRVDSLGIMEIISFVEDAFSVVVDDEDILPENFCSVRAMARFVAAKQVSTVAER
jgi:acyl carrier protein